jgi:hypothetical protein
MHVLREDFQIDSSLYSADFGVERSLGCHLMQVVDYMDSRSYSTPTTPEELATREARFMTGYLWEHTMAREAIAAELRNSSTTTRLTRPGQLMWCYQCRRTIHGRTQSESHCARYGHVGIFATPDAVLVYDWATKEWKFTSKSLRSCGGDQYLPLGATEPVAEHERYEHISVGMWRWVAQVMGYCFLLETTKAVLEGCFLVGDYGVTTRDPKTCRYTFTFEQQELERHWESVLFHAVDGELLQVAA